MERNEFLDFAKGLLIVLVCIGHAIQFTIYQNAGFWLDPLYKSIYMFHMPLFMAIAGYLSYPGVTGTSARFAYVSRRTLSCLLPVVAWAAIYQLAFNFDRPHLLANLPAAIGREALNSFWFLWALAGSVALVALAPVAGKYRAWAIVGIFAATLLLPDVGTLHLFKYTFPFFVAGFFVAGWKPTWHLPARHRWITTAALGIGSLVCFAYWDEQAYVYVSGMGLSAANYGNVLFRWLAGFVASGFALLLMQYLYRVSPAVVAKALTAAGRDSIYIYVIQDFAFIFLPALFVRFFDPAANLPLGRFLGVLTGIAVAWGCWLAGNVLARNRRLAYVFFGKTNKRFAR